MKESTLMRVLFCKIHCPFICSCKPSVSHLYTPEPLKLENSTPNIVPTAIVGSESFANNSCREGKEESVNGDKKATFVGKSCLKKLPNIVPDSAEEVGKKRVQWIDNFGKELAEVKEFESSETGDTDNEEESNRCFCVIL